MNDRVPVPRRETLAEPDLHEFSDTEVADLKVVPRRHYGRWITGAVLALLTVGLFRTLVDNPNIDWAVVADYLFSSEILTGLKNTLIITVFAMLIAVVLGNIVAVMRTSKNPMASWLAWAFAYAFRSTPVLVQLFFWFNLALIFPELSLGVPGTALTFATWETNAVMTPLVASVIALGLAESAYYSEIVRSGLISVDPGQREAAQTIGMSGFQVFRKVVLPQTIRVILPSTGNELISMLKYSALASVIGFNELAGAAAQVYSLNLKTVELLLVVSFWYFLVTAILSVVQYFLERHYGRGYGPSVQPASFSSRLRSNLRFRST